MTCRLALLVLIAVGSLCHAAPTSLFKPTDMPQVITANDPNPVELGLKFQTSIPGKITAIRFYKGPKNTGTHIGHLWDTSGKLLATVNFTNESTSGWQQASLSTPFTPSIGTTYIVSYHCNAYYSLNEHYFTGSRTNGYITAPSSSSAKGNGVYVYGRRSAFPNQTYAESNYWIDVVITPNSDKSSQVTLSWDRSLSGSVTGYYLYYGTTSKQYAKKINVGTALTTTINNLSTTQTYYFAATAYDASGRESNPSNEVSY
jgi:hypothetical protein